MYPPRRKRSHKKIYLAVILLAVLASATAAIVYYSTAGAPKPVKIGVNVGDTFTYSMKGMATLTGIDASVPDYFYQYNATDYYRVTVTDVQATTVSLASEWKFLNGTIVNENQSIDVSNGNKTNLYGFWAVYASNLGAKDLLRPTGFDGRIVNSTETTKYADSIRPVNYFSVEEEFWDVNDPTHNTLRYDNMRVYFDQETGMLTTLINYQSYNNPQMSLAITWNLIESSVWKVK